LRIVQPEASLRKCAHDRARRAGLANSGLAPHLHMITTIVSGAQTGADRAALDAATACGVAFTGWVPRGRAAEDGVIPAHYAGLRETAADEPAVRTELNVRDSDGTLIISHGKLHGGSRHTLDVAHRLGRPVLHLDLDRLDADAAVATAAEWVAAHSIRCLNVAGPRASGDARIYAATFAVVSALLNGGKRPSCDSEGR
jgi:hypothetical protein